MNLIDNKALRRFELTEKGLTVFADYQRYGTTLVLPHVEAAPALRGTGAAARLMEEIVAYARGNGLSVAPRCSYARIWFQRHPESTDLLA